MKKGMFILPLAAAMLIFTGCDFQSETTPDVSSDDFTIAEIEVGALKSLESTEEEIAAARVAITQPLTLEIMILPGKT